MHTALCLCPHLGTPTYDTCVCPYRGHWKRKAVSFAIWLPAHRLLRICFCHSHQHLPIAESKGSTLISILPIGSAQVGRVEESHISLLPWISRSQAALLLLLLWFLLTLFPHHWIFSRVLTLALFCMLTSPKGAQHSSLS